tara:strand:+ start:2562 stop:2933 length:372 start_codon:yes stop_codon:yes gene_type:complete
MPISMPRGNVGKRCGKKGLKELLAKRISKKPQRPLRRERLRKSRSGGAMYKWSYGDVVINILAYTQGSYPSKDVMSMADAIWKKQAGPKMTLIPMETPSLGGVATNAFDFDIPEDESEEEAEE